MIEAKMTTRIVAKLEVTGTLDELEDLSRDLDSGHSDGSARKVICTAMDRHIDSITDGPPKIVPSLAWKPADGVLVADARPPGDARYRVIYQTGGGRWVAGLGSVEIHQGSAIDCMIACEEHNHKPDTESRKSAPPSPIVWAETSPGVWEAKTQSPGCNHYRVYESSNYKVWFAVAGAVRIAKGDRKACMAACEEHERSLVSPPSQSRP